MTRNNKNLWDYINEALDDENGAHDDYSEMIELCSSDPNLTDNEKGLIVGILFKIRNDEGTHKVLLEILRDVLSTYYKK